jgi:hypothetical protein
MENKNEVLGGLTEEQRNRIREWLEDGKTIREVEELSEKPWPEGLGVRVSRSAVGRFAKSEQRAKFLAELGEDEAAAEELMRLTEEGAVDFTKATMQILQRNVFKAAAEAKGEAACEMLRKLTEMEQRGQRIQLAERSHQLSRERYEMNTSRELLKKARSYVEIHQLVTVDDEHKVRAARQICFGGGVVGEGEQAGRDPSPLIPLLPGEGKKEPAIEVGSEEATGK